MKRAEHLWVDCSCRRWARTLLYVSFRQESQVPPCWEILLHPTFVLRPAPNPPGSGRPGAGAIDQPSLLSAGHYCPHSSTNNFALWLCGSKVHSWRLCNVFASSRATQSNFDVAAQQLSVTLLVLVDISHRSKTCHWPSHHQSQAVSTPLQGNKWLSSGSSTSGRKEGLSSGCVPGDHPIGKQYRCWTGHNSIPLPGSKWLSIQSSILVTEVYY